MLVTQGFILFYTTGNEEDQGDLIDCLRFPYIFCCTPNDIDFRTITSNI